MPDIFNYILLLQVLFAAEIKVLMFKFNLSRDFPTITRLGERMRLLESKQSLSLVSMQSIEFQESRGSVQHDLGLVSR